MYRALRVPAFATGGMVWGILAFLFGNEAFGEAIWFGVLASPFIGVAVGSAWQDRFEVGAPRARWVIALLSLYLGVTLFGLAVGTHAWNEGTRPLGTAVSEGVVSAWYGITGTGFFLLFWPLTYLTHGLLARVTGVILPD